MTGDEHEVSRGTGTDGDDHRLTYAVVEAVAAHEGISVTELPPLGQVIDPDALDSLFESPLDGTARTAGTVTFEYCGLTVAAHADGRVVVE